MGGWEVTLETTTPTVDEEGTSFAGLQPDISEVLRNIGGYLVGRTIPSFCIRDSSVVGFMRKI